MSPDCLAYSLDSVTFHTLMASIPSTFLLHPRYSHTNACGELLSCRSNMGPMRVLPVCSHRNNPLYNCNLKNVNLMNAGINLQNVAAVLVLLCDALCQSSFVSSRRMVGVNF